MMETKPDWEVRHLVPAKNCPICNGKPLDMDRMYPSIIPEFGNSHTVGLKKYGHKELCIPFLLTGKVACGILNLMGYMVKYGDRFDPGVHSGVLSDSYEIQVISVNDDDDMLYVILPDRENRFPDDEGCDWPFRMQYVYAALIANGMDFPEFSWEKHGHIGRHA